LCVLIVVVLLVTRPANGALTSGNLLQNPGAEAGSCSTDGTAVESIPGWNTGGSNFTVTCYGASGFPNASVGSSINGGSGFFAGGPDNAVSAASQNVDVSSAASSIDAGSAEVDLSGYLGGFSSQEDNVVIKARFLNGSGQKVGSVLQIGPVTAAARHDQTTLLRRSASASVPVGTRSIQVTMTATRTDGSDNDGYADNLSLMLGSAGVPLPGRSVDVAPVSGVVRVKQPGRKGFTRLHAGEQIPVGSTINATHGVVSLVAARDRHGHTATGQAHGAVFRLTQRRKAGVELTVLVLAGGKPTGCSAKGASTARGARHQPLVVRDPGYFVTVGINASARDRATKHTKWWTEDTCAGTRITAVRGAVLVNDFPHHRTFLLRAGHHFLAHPGKGG
jgi:hypothetical protein